MHIVLRSFAVVMVSLAAFIPTRAEAQANLPIYTDSLVNGFGDWGWATHNYANPAPVHSGGNSVSVTITGNTYEGLQIVRSAFDSTPYGSVSFWINGGTNGGQRLQLAGLAQNGTTQNVWQTSYSLGTLQTNTWQQFTVPLTALGLANKSNATGLVFQDRIGAAQPTFYLDDIQFDAKAAPVLVHISLNATQSVRTVDTRHFGVNLAMWDSYFDPPNHTTTISLLQEMGTTIVRMPGGSLSDQYHWGSNTTLTNTWQWSASFNDMVRVTTNVGAQAFVTVNYGSGTPQEAAAWVRYANITNHLGFKYWEIGNECYGTWETDTNPLPNHAYTYAVRASNYIAQMKAADPTIKIGLVAVPGESSYANGYTDHPALNPRTGQTKYGWTPVLLTTLKSLGVTPDFLVHHVYPQWTDPNDPSASPDNDDTLLQSTGNWAADAADLRQQITDYFGVSGTNIELVVTENNSDSGAQGRQSTSLVNGLYYADSLAQLLKTEFRGFVWWDLRNGTDTGGFFGPALYGWRTYGDLGMINGLNTRHPTFYAAKLMQWFARPGDKILTTTSDYSSLTAYAARRANGSVALLVLNKSSTTALNGQIALTGFTPTASAVLRSFGIPNDEAARTNGPAAAQDLTTNNIANAAPTFTNTFPPLSLTLLTLSPAAPKLAAISPAPAGQFVFQLQGQPDVRYVIQNSSNLTSWVSVSTNTLTGPTLNVTNAVSPGVANQFWRAVWQP